MESNKNSHSRTTIHSLPLEILINILSLTILDQHCLIEDLRDSPALKGICGPDTLSRVCSLWRHVIHQFPSLWSHIDIALNHPLNPRLVARAHFLSERAGSTPLEIHIFDLTFMVRLKNGRFASGVGRHGRSSPSTPKIDPSTICNFELSQSAPMRIQSLDFNYTLQRGLHTYHMSALQYFLSKCTPNILTHFSMTGWVPTHASFIEPADHPQTFNSVLLDIPSQLFESVWLGTTHLMLNGLCPHWGSKAYHGLVELRIGRSVPVMTEAQFANILRYSPGLRVLHITSVVEDLLPLDDPVVPVHLEDLEDLKLRNFQGKDLGTSDEMLRWIAPGPKPLQVNFDQYAPKEAISFCARSNIARLFFTISTEEIVAPMVHRCSWLEILALSAGLYPARDLCSILHPIDGRHPTGLVSTTKVDTLYLANFMVLPLSDLEDAVAEYSVRRLIIRNSRIEYKAEEGLKEAGDPSEIRTLLSTLKCSIVEYLEERCWLDQAGW
ncbi:hypothetical protein RHS02_00062, partial [Rhizoctonia solani]